MGQHTNNVLEPQPTTAASTVGVAAKATASAKTKRSIVEPIERRVPDENIAVVAAQSTDVPVVMKMMSNGVSKVFDKSSAVLALILTFMGAVLVL